MFIVFFWCFFLCFFKLELGLYSFLLVFFVFKVELGVSIVVCC